MSVTVMCDHCGGAIAPHGRTEDQWKVKYASVDLGTISLHFHPVCGVDLLGEAVAKGYADAIRIRHKQVTG